MPLLKITAEEIEKIRSCERILNQMPKQSLYARYRLGNKVASSRMSDYTKAGLVADILRDQFGDRRVDAAFGTN